MDDLFLNRLSVSTSWDVLLQRGVKLRFGGLIFLRTLIRCVEVERASLPILVTVIPSSMEQDFVIADVSGNKIIMDSSKMVTCGVDTVLSLETRF